MDNLSTFLGIFIISVVFALSFGATMWLLIGGIHKLMNCAINMWYALECWWYHRKMPIREWE